jgi:hypothetical protein
MVTLLLCDDHELSDCSDEIWSFRCPMVSAELVLGAVEDENSPVLSVVFFHKLWELPSAHRTELPHQVRPAPYAQRMTARVV